MSWLKTYVQPPEQQPTPVMLMRGARGRLGRLLKDALWEEDPLDCPTPTFSQRCTEPRATLWQRLKYSTLQILFLQGTGLCQVWLESEKLYVPPAACVCDCRPATDSSLMPMDGTGGSTAAHKALHTLHHLLRLQLLHPFLLSVTQWCPTLCEPMDCSTPGFPVLHHLPEFAQTHVH